MDTLLPPAPAPRSPEDLSRLVHQIYACAARPQGWNDAVAAIGASMGASKGLLLTPYIGPQQGGLLFPWRISCQALQLWESHYIDHDIWSRRAYERGLWREGATYISEDLVSDDDLHRSVFYREFLRPNGIEHLCTSIVFEGSAGLPHTSAAFYRDRQAAPFNAQDKAWLALLVGHLSRSLGLMQRLSAAELHAASLCSTLDQLEFGVALLDGKQQLLYLNAAGNTVLARGDGLTLGLNRTLDTRPRDGVRLQQWLSATGEAGPRQASHFSDGFLVSRHGTDAQYFLQYAILPPSDTWTFDSAPVRYVVFITDPAATRLPDAERLASLYGLTAAEARVALELAQGLSQKQVARGLQIAASTARTHTQNVFAKMRIHRHADLIRMVLALGRVRA